MPLDLVSKQHRWFLVVLVQAKLPYLQKAMAVVMTVNLAYNIATNRVGWDVLDYMHIQENIPSPLLPQSSVQKSGGEGWGIRRAYFQELTVYICIGIR